MLDNADKIFKVNSLDIDFLNKVLKYTFINK